MGDRVGPVDADEVVEVAEVVGDLVVGDGQAGRQQPDPLDRGPERRRVVLEHHVPDHLVEVVELVLGEVLHQAEVEEGDPAAGVEQVVARVGVAVEGPQAVEAAEGEAVEGLGGQVLLVLGPGEQLVPAHAVGELGGEHPAGREVGHHRGHVDRGMAVVGLGEHLLVAGLGAVVELLDQALAQLGHERLGVEAREQLAEPAEEQAGVVEVGGDGLGDPRVLHLHRHGPAVVGDGPVDLADRRRGDRHGVPLGEDLVGLAAELLADHPGGQLGAHRRGVVLELGHATTGNDVWLIKTNASGDTLWTRTFGEIGSDGGYSVQQTADGGFIVTGSKSTFDGNGSYVWLIKTDAAGDTLWTKTFWGYYSGNAGQAVQQTEDEGYVISGYTEAWDYSNGEVWLIKTDSSGDTLWTKTFGGSQREYGNSIRQTEDDGYIIAGSTHSFGAGNSDLWLIKTDALGDTLWTRTYGGSSVDRAYYIQQTADAGYIITGSTHSFGAGNYDVWLIKTNASGDTLWTRTYGGRGEDCGNAVQQTDDKGYILSGYTSSFPAGIRDAWLIKTDDASGDIIWTKTFGGGDHDAGYDVRQTPDGGYIIAGYTSSYGSGGSDVWLIKTTSDVNPIYEDNIDNTSDYDLHQNYPNPFNPSTTIEFDIHSSGFVSLKVYNIVGQEVAILVNKELSQGNHKVEWKPENLSSGLYFYKVETTGYQETKKLILMK